MKKETHKTKEPKHHEVHKEVPKVEIIEPPKLQELPAKETSEDRLHKIEEEISKIKHKLNQVPNTGDKI